MTPSDDPITAAGIFNDLAETLEWRWVAGQGGAGRIFFDGTVARADATADLVGYLNLIHHNRIQVLGRREIEFFGTMAVTDRMQKQSELDSVASPAMVLADDLPVPPWLLEYARTGHIPLFLVAQPASRVIDAIRAYLTKRLALTTNMHGVMLDILGMGVIITGESGLGKSELGLELISRGSGLVADDCVDLSRMNHSTIEGRCPELLKNLMEVRGIGLLDIKAIYGETAVRRSMRLKLVVQLEQKDRFEEHYERLPTTLNFERILEVPVRKIYLPVEAGRNLAVLVEAAVRNTIMQLRGIDTMREFSQRQQAAIR